MQMDKRGLDDILDECLDRLASGEGIDECASRYPEHRAELLPMLRVAAAMMKAASTTAYRPESKARGLNRLTNAVAQGGVSRRAWYSRVAWPRGVPRPLVAGVVAVFMTAGMAFGTGVASSDSVPGDPLYWVKTQKENITLMLPRSDMGKAQLHARLARERVDEMDRLADKEEFDVAIGLIKRHRHHLNESTRYAGFSPLTNSMEMPAPSPGVLIGKDAIDLRMNLQHDMSEVRARFAQRMQAAPPGAFLLLEQLSRNSEFDYYAVIVAMEGSPVPTRQSVWQPRQPHMMQQR